MNRDGEIIIIKDDEEGRYVLEYVFEKLNYPNRRAYFKDGRSALEYLNNPHTEPFIILSDINLPYMDGLELRNQLKTDSEIRLKSIPYLYLTGPVDHELIVEAYSKSAQGFFIKPSSIEALVALVETIMDYWLMCAMPKTN